MAQKDEMDWQANKQGQRAGAVSLKFHIMLISEK